MPNWINLPITRLKEAPISSAKSPTVMVSGICTTKSSTGCLGVSSFFFFFLRSFCLVFSKKSLFSSSNLFSSYLRLLDFFLLFILILGFSTTKVSRLSSLSCCLLFGFLWKSLPSSFLKSSFLKSLFLLNGFLFLLSLLRLSLLSLLSRPSLLLSPRLSPRFLFLKSFCCLSFLSLFCCSISLASTFFLASVT